MTGNHEQEHILLACASGQLGGTELRMLEEGRALRSMGHSVTVATPPFGRDSRFRSLLSESEIPHIEFRPPAILNNWRGRYWEYLRGLASRAGPIASADLVHVFMPWTNQGLDQIWQAGRARVPTVISVHNAFTLNRPLSTWHQQHLRRAFSSVRGVYGVSERALQSFDEVFSLYLPERVHREVIYNFVDMDRFKPSADLRRKTRAELGIADDVPLFGSVGRLDKQKRPLSLVAVFKEIKGSLPHARFLLIGQGKLEGEVREALRNLGLDQATIVLPFRNDVEACFPALDAHLLLSRNEGFGIVTAEALACGVPVVGSDVVGTQEVIDDCKAGRLVPLGDESAAAAASVELYAKRDELAKVGRDYVASRFSKEIWRRKIEAFYNAILSGARSP